jgi:hypothetical protein
MFALQIVVLNWYQMQVVKAKVYITLLNRNPAWYMPLLWTLMKRNY